MPPNQKLREYISFKANPNLAMFQELQKIRKEAETAIQDIAKQTERAITREMEGVRQYISTLTEKAVQEQIFGKITVLKGEKGDKPIAGIDYPIPKDGYTPVKNKDYFDGKDGKTIIGPPGPAGKDGKSIVGPKGKDGIDGKTPLLGIDYFTKTDIQDFISKVKEQIDMEKILQQLAELKKMIEEIKREKVFGGVQKSLTGGGGPSLVWNENLGTGDNLTTQFTLANTPYSTTNLQVWVGGGIMFLTDDFTISGRIITFITAPPTDAVVRATYHKQ